MITPAGRREVPLAELLDLLEQAERIGAATAARPLARVLGQRRRAAEAGIDVDRLLPPRRSRTHRAPELQSLAYHRLVAERLDDRSVEQAQRRLARWKASGQIHPRWADEWEQILARPLPQIAKAIAADTPRVRELRQTSPFAGALNEHERLLLVAAVERRGDA